MFRRYRATMTSCMVLFRPNHLLALDCTSNVGYLPPELASTRRNASNRVKIRRLALGGL